MWLRARTSRRTTTMMMMMTITMIMMLVMSRVKVMIQGVFFLPFCSCYYYSYYACFHQPAIHHYFYDDKSKPPCNDFSCS